MKLPDKLTELKRHGWVCNHPDKIHTIAALDKRNRRCVWAFGPVVGYADIIAAYISTEDDCVMVLGEAVRDLEFDDFLRWIIDGDAVNRPVVKSAPLPNQKSLFE